MAEENTKDSLILNKDAIDVLVANIIPTTKYFENRFDFMQHQVDETNKNIRNLESHMNQRFEQVDQRFEQVDKRFGQVDRHFEQVDKRFGQVDKRFEQVDRDIRDLRDKVEILGDRIHVLTTEVKTSVRDYIIERDRYYSRRFDNMRMFVIALLVGVGGLFLKVVGFFDKLFK